MHYGCREKDFISIKTTETEQDTIGAFPGQNPSMSTACLSSVEKL